MQTLEDLIELVEKIRARDSEDEWHSAMLVKTSKGVYAVYEREYSPGYDSRSSNWQVSEDLTKLQALQLYISLRGKIKSGMGWYGDDMLDSMKESIDFVLSHYSDVELKDYMKRRKSGVIIEKKEIIAKEKADIQKQIEELQLKAANLNAEERLYEV